MTNAYFKWILVGSLMIGLGCAGFFLVTFQSQLVLPQARFFDIWIPLVVSVFIMILVRSLKPGQPFHFWEGLLCGNLMIWFGGLLSGLLLWQISLVWPEPLQNFIQSSIRYLNETQKHLPEEQKMKDLPQQIEHIRNTSASYFVLDELKKKVVYSFILVPLISMIFRRK